MKLLNRSRKVLNDRRGATSIEYALIILIVSLGVIGMASAIGQHSNATFGTLAETIEES